MKGEIKMGVVNKTIEDLKRIDIDGETMQYIIEKLGMNDQMLRQLILSNPQSDTIDLLNEHIHLNDLELKKINEEKKIKDCVLELKEDQKKFDEIIKTIRHVQDK